METQKTGIAKFNNRFGDLGGFLARTAQTTATPSPKSVKRFTAPAQPEVVITAAAEPKPVKAKVPTPTKVVTTKSVHEEDVLKTILTVPGGLSEADITTRLKKQKFNLLPGQLATMLKSLEEKRRIMHVGRTDKELWRKRT